MLQPLPLGGGVRSRMVTTVTGLDMHVLECGEPQAPLLLLLHGFPELAFSWRHVMPVLARAGYYVVAPDLRGYGRTTGWDNAYDGDLRSFTLPNLVRDLIALLSALQRPQIHCVIGHDFGSRLAAWAALLRPDIFPAVVMMSAPFAGPPGLEATDPDPDQALRLLNPARKHYQWYYCSAEANTDMMNAPQGLQAFLRAYFHMKSADWQGNRPESLGAWNAEALARLPEYYVMKLEDDMPSAVSPAMPDQAAIAACEWLPDEALAIYVAEFGRSGFQGGLNWYRTSAIPTYIRDLSVFAGTKIQGPASFIAGAADWGYQQNPGALEAMSTTSCADYRGTRLIPGAGHWVQQEQPQATADAILDFVSQLS